MTNVKADLENYLKTKDYLHLATIAWDGKPMAATLGYASEGAVVYFSTGKDSSKYKNITRNSYVAYTVDDESKNWMKAKGVQMQAIAKEVKDPSEVQKVYGLMLKKFPALKDLKMDPSASVVIKLEPRRGYFLDYTKGFGHREEIKY